MSNYFPGVPADVANAYGNYFLNDQQTIPNGSSIQGLQNGINSLNSQVTMLQAQLVSIQQQIVNMQTQLTAAQSTFVTTVSNGLQQGINYD